MPPSLHLSFQSPPKLGLGMLRDALRPRSGNIQDGLPDIRGTLGPLRIDGERLRAYRSLCGEPATGPLPPLYPQILAVPMHTAMLTAPAFPFAPMGIVHARQRVVEHEPLREDDVLQIQSWFGTLRPVARGHEFDLHTHVIVGGRVIWEGCTSILVRTKKPGDAHVPAAAPEPSVSDGALAHDDPGDPSALGQRPAVGSTPGERAAWMDVRERLRWVDWMIPRDLGRRYTWVAQDWNPIHLSRWTAKPFGFDRAIIQGMWTLARSLGEVGPQMPTYPRQIDAKFERPVLLPSRVLFHAVRDDTGVGFAWRSHNGEKRHLVGEVTPYSAPEPPKPSSRRAARS